MRVHINEFLNRRITVSDFISTYALILLNSNSMQTNILGAIWNNFGYKICADGAANLLFDGLSGNDKICFLPNAIAGDLDSLRSDVRDYYTSLGVEVIKDPDQDTNDLDKCLQIIKRLVCASTTKPVTVVVYGAFGGRFDQELSSINSLYRWKGMFDRIVLMDQSNLAFLLEGSTTSSCSILTASDDYSKEIHPISYSSSFEGTGLGYHRLSWLPEQATALCEGPICGMVPIGGAVDTVWTCGLKWDIHGECMRLGGLVSTSNSIRSTKDTGKDILTFSQKFPVFKQRSRTRDDSMVSPIVDSEEEYKEENNKLGDSGIDELAGAYDKGSDHQLGLSDVLVATSHDILWTVSLRSCSDS